MKRCSTCNRTYTDPNLSFCIEDGMPLTVVAEDESTVVSPGRNTSAGDGDWNAPYRPPGSYVPPPGAPAGKRRVWPWVLGIGGAFLLGIIAISIAAAVLAPRLMRRAQNDRANSNVTLGNANQNVNRSEPSQNSNVAPPANTNSNTNSETPDYINTPPPTDHDQVMTQLRELENEWTVANLNADKEKLAVILADDYVGPAPDGGLQSKADYIRTIRRDTDIDSWEFKDLKLLLAGDRATLSGTVSLIRRGTEEVFDFKDKFVWRDNRWQATGSEVTPKE